MKYNLGEEEDLTHHGQSLSTIEKFEKPVSDDDFDSDDDCNSGMLGAEFVEKAHFGGGVLSKAGDGKSSHRDLIDKLIAESKLRKYEKKQLKQETNELTEQLDKDWKELIPVVPTKYRGEMDNEDEPPTKKKVDKNSYDVLMRSLKFDRRGMASDKLKSDEEIAKEEKQRLEKLELERLKRMKGFENDGIVKHRSADDLDDGFDFGDDDVQPLAYDSEGKPLNCGDLIAVNEETNGLINEENENDSDNGNESNIGSDEVLEDDDENENNLNNDMSDLKEDSSDNDETNEVAEETDKNKSNLFTQKLKEKKVIMDEARKQLPYTFIVAESYEGFQEILEDRSVAEQTVIIERMIKVNHPSLGNDNRSNLQRLYPYLLQHLNDNSCSVEGWKILNSLAPHFYDLTQFFPEHAAKCFIEVLKEKHTDFVESLQKQITSDLLIFLKLVPLLFPSSDYYHPVCTYAVMIASQILSQSKIKKRSDIASCLLLTTILLEYIQLSKRYIPETINTLRGMLLMAFENTITVSHVQQFRPNMKMLVLKNNVTQIEWPTKLSVNEIFIEKDLDDAFKLTSLYVTLDLVCRFCKLCEDIPSIHEIWEPHLSIINKFKIDSDKMSVQIDKTITQLQIINKKLEKLQTLSNRPKALRLYEPRIQKVYDGRTFKTQSKENAERTKLQHRYKREMKSAVREIRKDNSFLSKLKYHEQVKSDTERRNKVKQIYSWGASQAHEVNKLAKKNKK